MEKIKCFIVDDDEPAIELLQYFIAEESELELIGFSHSISGIPINLINNELLFFLDIQMPNKTGIDFLRESHDKLNVILTTSQNNYALEAYDLSVIDYLLKPFSQSRFKEAVQKAISVFKLNRIDKLALENHIIEVKHDYKTLKINTFDILYIEGLKQYLKIVTKERSYIILDSFKNLELKLPAYFIRVHKSFLVNKLSITKYSKTHLYIDKKEIPLSSKFDNDKLL
jgi:two-component system, LytTR family, response regulator